MFIPPAVSDECDLSVALIQRSQQEPNPDNTGCPTAEWVTKIGLADSGKANHALVLTKDCPNPTNAAAGATIDGADGQVADEFGFDIKGDTYCGAGATRFNLLASDGFHFIGGCANGTHTPGPAAGWTRVRFDAQNPAQAFPPVTPGATIISLTLLHDEQGSATLDNIYVNGTLIGKPGNA